MTSNAGRGRGMGRGKGGGRGRGDGDGLLSIIQNATVEANTHDNMVNVGDTPLNGGTQLENQISEENDGEGSTTATVELDPVSLWFEHSKVTRAITNAIKMYYVAPWRNWTEVDEDTKDQWFRLFKRSCTWRPELEVHVRKDFDKKGAKRLKDLRHWLTSDRPRKKGKVCPPWMHVDVHKQVLDGLEDPEFMKRSARAKNNKRRGSMVSLHPGHVQGSISTLEIAQRMAAKEGALPTAAEVYLKTHTKIDVALGTVPCSDKPKKVMVKNL